MINNKENVENTNNSVIFNGTNLPYLVLIDINELTTNDTKQSMINMINDKGELKLGSKLIKVNSPVFNYIINYPNGEYIPYEILSNYVGETNLHNQTPLMLATVINNFNYVKQLINMDIGKIDDFNISALDYAQKYKVNNSIISLLSEYETY